MKFTRFFAGLGVLASMSITVAHAQYPERPVKIINPFSVGGSGDAMQRLFAQKLTERTGKTFYVDNKVGASGRIGYDAVAKSPGDGYTLAAADATYTILPALYGKLPWNPATDLLPVTVYARTPFVLVVNPQSKFKSFKDLVQYAKANPGKINFGSAGIGSINHLVMEVVAREAGVTMTHVPYKGMGEALNGVMSNAVDVIATGLPTAINPIKAGKAIPLGLTAQQRWPTLTNVPTLSEQGINVVTYSWFGMMAPKGTPKPVIDYLHQQVVKAIQDPSMKEPMDLQGVEPSGMSPAEFAKMLSEDTKQWTETVRAAKITVE
jgi:tripartite-type tricarboxylate transporter receptor subunit TctC